MDAWMHGLTHVLSRSCSFERRDELSFGEVGWETFLLGCSCFSKVHTVTSASFPHNKYTPSVQEEGCIQFYFNND